MQSEQQTITIPQAIQFGLEHHEAGRFSEAEGFYQQVLQIDPNHLVALHLLGAIAHQVGKNEIAVQLIDKALSIKPDYAEALYNRGNALHELKRYDEALASYDKALCIKPDYADALSNRGNALHELKCYDEALASYDKALCIKPDFADALSNRGLTLHELKRYDEALASYDKALSIKPDYAEALSNRGVVLHEFKRYDEALASYDKALSIKPDFADANWNESLCQLLIGDFEHGWKKHEWRWKLDKFPSERRNFAQPLWLGEEDIAGKTILLHAEQGLGDAIQFVRYARMVSERGAKAILEVQPTLRSLVSEISGPYQVLGRGEPLPEFDFHSPLMSLPLAFSTRLETIPSTVPYLSPPVDAVKKWEDNLGHRNAPRVGIVWSGSQVNTSQRHRHIALSRLVPLTNLGVTLVSLQNEVRTEDETVLAANQQIRHFGSELQDFSDTAALVSLMDLVISVDTSVAHLAGALGMPVWILLPFTPDWRWLLDREDSPWYPTARLFRQPKSGDWGSVIDKIKQHMTELSK